MNCSTSVVPLEFGHCLGEFNWNKPKAKGLFVVWSLMILPALLSCLFLIGIPATIFAIYFALRSWKRWRSPHPVVSLYQHGLIDQRQPQPVVIPYNTIETIFINVVRMAGIDGYVCTVQTTDKRKIQFDEHLAQIKDLGFLLQEQVVLHHLPKAIATYNQGLPVTFNSLSVAPSGIAMGKRHLSWDEFDSAEVIQMRSYKSVQVFVAIHQRHQQKPWALLVRETFPNLALFFALLNYIQNSATNCGVQQSI